MGVYGALWCGVVAGVMWWRLQGNVVCWYGDYAGVM